MGREILEPLVIAALLAFILSPLIRRLRSWGLWRVPSIIVAALLAIAVIAALGSAITLQVAQLAEELPKYETNLRTKIRAIGGGSLMSSSLERPQTR
jgi:predicted PurR-regulated permease PerM